MQHNNLMALQSGVNRRILSAISITGLTAGLACIMLVMLWAFDASPQTGACSVSPGGSHRTFNRGFNGKLTIGPDMMYALPREEKPVLLAICATAPDAVPTATGRILRND